MIRAAFPSNPKGTGSSPLLRSTDEPIVVRTCDLPPSLQHSAIRYAGQAQRTAGNEIGWLPWQAYERANARRELITVIRAGELVGHALFLPTQNQPCKIAQIWIRPDARILENGRAAIAWIERYAAAPSRATALQAWVAEDLAANVFWQAIGFTAIAWRWGRAKKSRRHLLWRRPLKASAVQT